MTISPMKFALQSIAALCDEGGKVFLPISAEDRRAIEPALSLMARKRSALITITGSDGDFTADIRPIKRDKAPKPRGRSASPERQAIEALEPGQSFTISTSTMSLESIDQKIHAVQRNLGVTLTRHYDSKARAVTVTRIDKVPGGQAPDELRSKSRGRAPKYQLQAMNPGDVLFMTGGADLRTMRTTCTYHSKSRADAEYKAVESDYDGAIEIHCLPRTTNAKTVDAARQSIKKQRIARVLDGEAILKPDGSTFSSTIGSSPTGYDGVKFFTSMIDDALEVVSPGETVHFHGAQPRKLAERANYWAGVRNLKAVILPYSVRFE